MLKFIACAGVAIGALAGTAQAMPVLPSSMHMDGLIATDVQKMGYYRRYGYGYSSPRYGYGYSSPRYGSYRSYGYGGYRGYRSYGYGYAR